MIEVSDEYKILLRNVNSACEFVIFCVPGSENECYVCLEDKTWPDEENHRTGWPETLKEGESPEKLVDRVLEKIKKIMQSSALHMKRILEERGVNVNN